MTQPSLKSRLQPNVARVSSNQLIRWASAAVALLAVLIIIGWYAHWTRVLQLFPNSAAVKFNTGVCFLFCSFGIALLTTRHAKAAAATGILAILMGVATLLEYFTALPFIIDESLVRDYIYSATDFPGRMSQLAAGCFVLMGVALVFAATGTGRWRTAIVGSLACIVSVIAAVALVGYLFGVEEAYGWGAYTRMAMHTAAAFLLLGAALYEWTNQAARRQHSDLRGWLPMISSATLMIMVGIVSRVSVAHLNNANAWSSHTYDVLFAAEKLTGDIADLRHGSHGYVLSGQMDALEPYRSGLRSVPLQLAELRTLTRDNGSQKPRLDKLTADIADIRGYTRALMDLRDSAGLEAASLLESTGQGRALMDRTRADLADFADEERRLLALRNASGAKNLSNTAHLLVLASTLAAALIIWAHIRGILEMRRRRRAEVELQGISTLQAAILDSANYAIISSSADRNITTFNATAERWLGYAASEVVGKAAPIDWYDAAEVAARAQELSTELGIPITGSYETFVTMARLGRSNEQEWTMIRKDGSRFPVWRSVTPQIDAAGNTVGFVSVITDITERKKQEAELRLSQERFRRAFDDAPIGMALVSPAGRWLKVNRALCEMLDYTNQELLQMDIQKVTHRDDLQITLEFIHNALAGHESSYHLDKRYFRKDGSLLYAKLSVSLVREADGTPLYFVTQIEDITQRREMDRMKDEFISTVSHELRTPLTSIRGALGLLEAGVLGPLSEKARPMVKIAHANSERLVRIINDILDIEKISAGKMEMRIEAVPLKAFLEEALEASLPYGVKYKVGFALDAAADCAAILADRDRLMQVMANLLSNAAKFSPPGATVWVRSREYGGRARIEIEDRGTGIPAAFRARVFEKFAQADSSTSRQFEGTGLGLSITRELVRAMDGSIGFTSANDAGTTFFFELPQAVHAQQIVHATQCPDTARCKVLLYGKEVSTPRLRTDAPRILHVEDDTDICRVIDTALAGRADVVIARTVQAAAGLLRDMSFSLVVLDLELPDGNGLTLLTELAALAVEPTPVVILSATEVPHDVRLKVAAALVKSRVTEERIVATILEMLPYVPPAKALPGPLQHAS